MSGRYFLQAAFIARHGVTPVVILDRGQPVGLPEAVELLNALDDILAAVNEPRPGERATFAHEFGAPRFTPLREAIDAAASLAAAIGEGRL